MNSEYYGKLFNNDGHGKYFNPDAPEKLIRYVTRTNGSGKNDLVSWGGAGVLEYYGIEDVIGQFYLAQEKHTRNDGFGKYMNHEIFSFSEEGEYAAEKNRLDIDQIARQMAMDIFDYDHCRVVYGVHAPGKGSPLHIHFAVNAVSYLTGNKRHENMGKTLKRSIRFNGIISDEISKKKYNYRF